MFNCVQGECDPSNLHKHNVFKLIDWVELQFIFKTLVFVLSLANLRIPQWFGIVYYSGAYESGDYINVQYEIICLTYHCGRIFVK